MSNFFLLLISWNFCAYFCLCDFLHLLICVCWIICAIKSPPSWCMTFLIICLILFATILVRNFVLCSLEIELLSDSVFHCFFFLFLSSTVIRSTRINFGGRRIFEGNHHTKITIFHMIGPLWVVEVGIWQVWAQTGQINKFSSQY